MPEAENRASERSERLNNLLRPASDVLKHEVEITSLINKRHATPFQDLAFLDGQIATRREREMYDILSAFEIHDPIHERNNWAFTFGSHDYVLSVFGPSHGIVDAQVKSQIPTELRDKYIFAEGAVGALVIAAVIELGAVDNPALYEPIEGVPTLKMRVADHRKFVVVRSDFSEEEKLFDAV